MREELDFSGGTGKKLTHATIILAGVSSLAATILSAVSIWHQAKNYRKPLLQRYVIRILLMVPIYSLSSWSSIVSLRAALFVDPIRDLYEAFTIYTFFQLLINFIGGERASIILTYGREPVKHLWPMNYCLPKVDISDPHSFLAIKRGILQYAWLKPIIGFASIIMNATGTYKEGYIGLDSGYLWSCIAYNLSVTISLYSLGLFWGCMSKDLQPFRPVPKFLCVKLIIFASYWQGFLLSILVWMGIIPDNIGGYSSDNFASAIQDTLICLEMPIFAIGHWYAFSWHDYADLTISAARMPMKYAIRDALGIRDLIEDTKETFSGKKYKYRLFDSRDKILAHEESSSRVARMMEGMRYERGGKGKYWIPKPGEINARTPLLPGESGPITQQVGLPSGILSTAHNTLYGSGDTEEILSDPEEESLYVTARTLEYGDWNYPVITANEAPRDRWRISPPSSFTTSTNRFVAQSPNEYHTRQAQDRNLVVEEVGFKNRKPESQPSQKTNKLGEIKKSKKTLDERANRESANELNSQIQLTTEFSQSHQSQLVDLVIRDTAAEETERTRTMKEGDYSSNQIEPKRLMCAYGDNKRESTRENCKISEGEVAKNVSEQYDNRYRKRTEEPNDWEESQQWRGIITPPFELKPKYGLTGEIFENVWHSAKPFESAKENP